MKTISLAVLALFAALPAFAGTSVDITKPAQADGEIRIYNISGSVEVRAWDRNEIRVVGDLGTGVDHLVFEVEGGRTDIKVVGHRHRSSHMRSDLEIDVPAGSNIDVETVSASVSLEGLKGKEIEVETVSGEIEISDCTGEVEVESVSGSVIIEGSIRAVDVETTSGRIEISGAQEWVSAQSVSGRVEVEAGTLQRAKIETVSGRIELECGMQERGRLDLQSFSGSVVLSLHDLSDVRFDLETFSGDIECDFESEVRRVRRFLPGRSLEFTAGKGLARVSIETFSGNIVVSR